MVRLSICIATLNRGAFIGETLESIVGQLTDEVEIVIVDGASTDETPEVVAAIAQRAPSLRYFREERNGGVDRDYNLAVERARGEYCWLFTDDDLLKPGAVRAVLAEIEKGYDLVVVNTEVRTADLSGPIEASRLPFSGDRAYGPDDLARLFADAAAYLTFIGGVVIRRSIWLERERESYFGTVFIHVGVIFQRPLPGKSLVMTAPLIVSRFGNSLWTPRAFEIWMVKWPELVWSFPGIPDAAKRQVFRREPWKHPGVLVDFRAKGAYSIREYRQTILPRVRNFREKVVPYCIARTPGWLLNLLAILYLGLDRKRSPLLMEDMRISPHFYRKRLRSLIPAGCGTDAAGKR